MSDNPQRPTDDGCLECLFQLATAMIGHEIHGSLGWAIVDFFFAPWCWLKWIVCGELNRQVFERAFPFFFQ